MFRPSVPTSLSLADSFTLGCVTASSSAAGFTPTMASSEDPLSSVRNGYIAAPLRAWLSQLQQPGSDGPSPGKIVHFPCSPTSSTQRNYGKDIGL